MSTAKIHDKLSIMNFWEQKIENHTQMTEHEDERMKRSALSRLRMDWTTRLERQTKHLKKVHEERAKRLRPAEMTASA
ncbi:protein FAM240C [Brienomyrus brachyistius]|uniref:protein FAM240C n=1 Tax=Brienomyrus brachyistius TaxID=42636 RepID=UPI0020B345E7|nr:protein FAM240C [Brienomyrus brachyistius]